MELRYQPGQPIRLTILGASPRAVNATIHKMAGRQAQLRIEESVPACTAVRIDFEDAVLLADVQACEPDGNRQMALLEIREAIPLLSGLAHFITAVQQECQSAPLTSAFPVARATVGR